MIKLVLCLHRHPDMSRQQFQDYWLNNHWPLFQKFAETHKAKKYVQSDTLDTPLNEGVQVPRGMLKEYDGIAEIWWDSEEAFMEAMSSPEGQKLGELLLEDEANFLDHSRSTGFFTKEHIL